MKLRVLEHKIWLSPAPPQLNGQGGHGRNGHGGYMGNVHWTMDMVNWFSIPLLPHSTGPQINWSPCQCWESCKLEKIASQVFRRKIGDSSDSLFIFIIPPLPSPKHF